MYNSKGQAWKIIQYVSALLFSQLIFEIIRKLTSAVKSRLESAELV